MTQNKILFLQDSNGIADRIIQALNNDNLIFDYDISVSKSKFQQIIQDHNPSIIFWNKKKITLDFIHELGITPIDIEAPIILISNNITKKVILDCLKAGYFDCIDTNQIDQISIITSKAFEFYKLKRKIVTAEEIIKNDLLSYKTLIEQTSDIIFKGNFSGDFIEVNTAASLLSGYSKEELLKMNMNNLFTNEELHQKPLQYDKVNRGLTVTSERVLNTKNGSKIPIEMSTKLINGDHYHCIIKDLTDYKKAKKTLEKSEERLRDIIEHSPNLFYSHKSDGTFTFISKKTEHFFDCDPDYFIKMQSYMYTDNPINEEGKAKTKKAFETGEAQSPYIVELVGRKNRKIWVEVNERPVVKDGKITDIVGALVDITESKKISDALINSEKKYRGLFSKAPDPIISTNNEGTIIDCNIAFCNLLDIHKKHIINSHITKYIPLDELAHFNNSFNSLKKNKKYYGEQHLISKEGNHILTRVSASALYNDNGEYIGAITHLHNITEQRKVQNEIMAREARLSAIFRAADNISFLISTVDEKKSKIIEFSPGAERIFGYTRNEIIGKDVTILHDKETIENFSLYLNKMKKGDEGFKGQTTMIKKSGETFTAFHTAYPIFNDNGELIQALGVSIDLTNIINIENELKKREEQLSTLINTSPDIICFKDHDGKWLMANTAILSLLHLKDIDYIGKTNSEIANQSEFYKNYFLKCKETDETAWNNNEPSFSEESVPTTNGILKTIEVIKVPIFHSNGNRKALVVLGRDITKRKQLETQLQHSQKMEAIGLMASGIAHNFNNILQAIIGYVDFAKDGLDKSSQRFIDLDQISQLVKRATMLTRNLLAVGKEQTMNKTDIDINDIIAPIVDLVNRLNNNNIRIEFNPYNELPVIFADGGQIDQIVMNLTINAIDSMKDGGIIKIITKPVIINKKFCSTNAWAKAGNYILLSVSDTGHGMDEDTKRRIFEPFFTTKELQKGTGLGLSTVFGITTQHKGLLNVMSEKNEGTTFEIYLPIK